MTFFINKTDLALFILKGVVKSQVDIKIQFFVHLHMKGLVSFPWPIGVLLRQTQFTKPFNW